MKATQRVYVTVGGPARGESRGVPKPNPSWYFEWVGGGYNSVNAPTKEEALAAATELGRPKGHIRVTLVPDERTFTTDAAQQAAIVQRHWTD